MLRRGHPPLLGRTFIAAATAQASSNSCRVKEAPPKIRYHGTTCFGVRCVLAVVLAASSFAHAQAPVPSPAPSLPVETTGAAKKPFLSTTWNDAFVLQSDDGAFRLHAGGIVQADGRYFPGNISPGPVDQFAIRSARLELEGTVWRHFDFRVSVDFAGGRIQLQDGYTEVRFSPALRLRAGKFKVPFGLERLQSEGRYAFLERAFPTQLSPNRDIGLMIFGEVVDGAVQYAAGVFNGVADNSTLDTETDTDKEEAVRLFFHPLRPTGIRALRHLGVGGAFTFARLTGSADNPSLPALQTDGQTQFFRYVTGTPATNANTSIADGRRLRATAQGYFYLGRLGLFGEYVWSSEEVRRDLDHAALTASAWQAYASFLLTDDEASYAGVRPRRPFDLRAGSRAAGAWEILFRYSGIALANTIFDAAFADPTRSAGAATSLTGGVSWYPNANIKLLINYVHTSFTRGAEDAAHAVQDRASEDALMGRLQLTL